MKKYYLCFKLKAALVSFGDERAGNTRTTAFYPFKSSVLGLIGAALGNDKYSNNRIDYNCLLKFSYGVLEKGDIRCDLQNWRAPVSLGKRVPGNKEIKNGEITTKQTERFYLENHFSLICMEGDFDLLETIKIALETPKYPLYAGRKKYSISNPIPIVVEAATVENALNLYKNDLKIEKNFIRLGWEPSMNSSFEYQECIRRDNKVKTSLKEAYCVRDKKQETYQSDLFLFENRVERFWEDKT